MRDKSINREIKTDLENILSLISVAEDYGFNNSTLMSVFSDLLDNKLTDGEIEWYAHSIESMEEYGEYDYESIKNKLIQFRKTYCK